MYHEQYVHKFCYVYLQKIIRICLLIPPKSPLSSVLSKASQSESKVSSELFLVSNHYIPYSSHQSFIQPGLRTLTSLTLVEVLGIQKKDQGSICTSNLVKLRMYPPNISIIGNSNLFMTIHRKFCFVWVFFSCCLFI